MVRVIREINTGEYFKKGKWTANFDDAQQFEGIPAILKICVALELRDVEMVMRVDVDRPDLRIRIPNW